MSSDDSEFDKEAEREKLRKKFEDDEKDRENTRRMSELLLQGATMTGKHCDNCGDPIFRYDGQEFCPTCRHEAAANAQAATPSDASPESAADAGSPADDAVDADQAVTARSGGEDADATDRHATAPTAESDAPDDRGATEPDDEPRVEINDVRVSDRHVDTSNLRRPPSQQGGSEGDDRRGPGRDQPERSRRGFTRESERSPGERERGSQTREAPRARADPHARDAGERSAANDLPAARAALVRKLNDLARRAEETDDVARARELLAATREAAEAIAALDEANR